jgi:hypothetical protein
MGEGGHFVISPLVLIEKGKMSTWLGYISTVLGGLVVAGVESFD